MSQREYILDNLAHIQSLPSLATAACELTKEDSVEVADLEKLLAQDPSLSAQVLRVANSPFFGMSRTIDTIRDAVIVLGLKTTVNLIVAASVKQGMSQFPQIHLNIQKFWRHCNLVAGLSALVAKRCKQDRDQAYLSGLLHDIGRFILASQFPELYRKVKVAHMTTRRPHIEVEQELLGIDHTEAGGILGEKWNFPASVIDTISHHHTPAENRNSPAHVVHVCDVIGYALDCGIDSELPAPPLQPKALVKLAIPWPELPEIYAEAEQQLAHLLPS